MADVLNIIEEAKKVASGAGELRYKTDLIPAVLQRHIVPALSMVMAVWIGKIQETLDGIETIAAPAGLADTTASAVVTALADMPTDVATAVTTALADMPTDVATAVTTALADMPTTIATAVSTEITGETFISALATAIAAEMGGGT